MSASFNSTQVIIRKLQRKEVKRLEGLGKKVSPQLKEMLNSQQELSHSDSNTLLSKAKDYFSNSSDYVASFFYAQKKEEAIQNSQLMKNSPEIKSDSNNKLLKAEPINTFQLDERVTPHFYTAKTGVPENGGTPLCKPPDDIPFCRQGYNVRLDNMGGEIPFDPNLDNTYTILTQYEGQADPSFTDALIQHMSLPVIGNIVWRCNDVANLAAPREKKYYINTIENIASSQSTKAVVSILTDKVTETQNNCINVYYDELFHQYETIYSSNNNAYMGLLFVGFLGAAVVAGSCFVLVKRKRDPESLAWLPQLPIWLQGNYEQINTVNSNNIETPIFVNNSNSAQVRGNPNSTRVQLNNRVNDNFQEQKSPVAHIPKRSNTRYGSRGPRTYNNNNNYIAQSFQIDGSFSE